MSLFDLQPLSHDEIMARYLRAVSATRPSVTIKDRKGRVVRRRPYWIDVGKGPDGRTCKTCQYLVRTQYAKVYFKCGTWTITGGPGTQIATTDFCCSRYQRKGLPMFSIKDDRA